MAYDWNRLTDTSSIARDDGIKMLVYAQAGAGKTHLISTLCPDLSKVLIANSDGGTLTISGFRIPVAPIESFQDFADLLADIKKGAESGKLPYDWLAIDSFTEIVEKCLEVQKIANPDDTWAVYGDLKSIMIDLLKTIRDMRGVNVYVTAEMDKVKTETGKMLYGPRTPGKATAAKIPHIFDLVCPIRLETNAEGKLERWLQTEPDKSYEAKSRIQGLNRFEPPHIGELAVKIRENLPE